MVLSIADTGAMTVIITSVGAVLTTLLGVLVGSALSSRSDKRQWSRDQQAQACAQVLRESSNVLIEFVRLRRNTVESAPDGASVPTSMDWRAWNEALATVNLLADHEIVEAAHVIDDEIWPVHQLIKRGWMSQDGWPRQRDRIEARRQDFVNIARRHLVPPGPPLRRLTGRPPANDQFWEFRRSYFVADDSDPATTAEPEEHRPLDPTPVNQVSD
jgi:hypothetical protein